MLLRGIAADEKNGAGRSDVAQARGLSATSGESAGKGCVIGAALVVDVVGLEHRARELLQQVILFVGGAVGADDADGRAAARVANLLQFAGGNAKRVLPRGRFELAGRIANQRLRQAVGALDKVETEAALGAEEVVIDAALVAIVGANDFGAVVGGADAEGDFAAVGAVRADGGDVVHLPGPRLVAIAAAGERAHGAHVNAHAALFAVELMIVVGCDHGVCAAILDTERPNVHAFAAHADAAVTEDAARAIVEDGRRPLLLVAMMLGLDVLAFACAVLEGHVLEFTLATRVADRAIERVIAEKQFDGGLARLRDFGRVGDENLALGHGGGAGGLQLGNFFLAHDAHAAGGLEAEAGVIAEGWNLDAGFAAGVNEERPRWSGELFSIDCEGYVRHSSFAVPQGLKPRSFLSVIGTSQLVPVHEIGIAPTGLHISFTPVPHAEARG